MTKKFIGKGRLVKKGTGVSKGMKKLGTGNLTPKKPTKKRVKWRNLA